METLRKTADFLVRANVRERNFDADSKITPEEFAELKEKVTDTLIDLAVKLGASAAGGAVAGAGVAAGAYAAVGTFATASTGAAISGLTGVAARNATLAWLGGGTLASGGGGIAGGTAALANIAFAPLAILPAIVMSVKAYKQGVRVGNAIAEMDVSEAEMGKHKAELKAIGQRVQEESKAIHEVERNLKFLLDTASLEVLDDVYRVATAATSLAELLDLDDGSDPAGADVSA